MFKNLTIHRAVLPEGIELSAVEAALQAGVFVPCAATQDKSVGWVPPREAHGPLIESIAGEWIAAFMVEIKSVPASAVPQSAIAVPSGPKASSGDVVPAAFERVSKALKPSPFDRARTPTVRPPAVPSRMKEMICSPLGEAHGTGSPIPAALATRSGFTGLSSARAGPGTARNSVARQARATADRATPGGPECRRAGPDGPAGSFHSRSIALPGM